MNVILHQAAALAGNTSDFHGASGQPLATFLPHFDPADQDRLRVEFPTGTVYSRGATVGRGKVNEIQWSKINSGDLALFFRDNTLVGSGTVVLRTKNRNLASALGSGLAPDTRLPYELIYVVTNIQGWNIPRTEVWAAIGYDWNNQFGLRVLTDEKADRIIEWLADRETITADQYQNLLRRLQQLESTDREITAIGRKEQVFWKQLLFKNSALGTCALCGAILPTKLMVVAHIKPRHLCSHEERIDPHNVMPACVLGCDALFDKEMIYVEDGSIHVSRPDFPADLKRHVQALLGKKCRYWNPASAKYFAEHTRRTTGGA